MKSNRIHKQIQNNYKVNLNYYFLSSSYEMLQYYDNIS